MTLELIPYLYAMFHWTMLEVREVNSTTHLTIGEGSIVHCDDEVSLGVSGDGGCMEHLLTRFDGVTTSDMVDLVLGCSCS